MNDQLPETCPQPCPDPGHFARHLIEVMDWLRGLHFPADPDYRPHATVAVETP